MTLYLCVDCGGSKTSAVICNASGRILGRALAGPSNVAYLGLDAFISVVTEAVGDALKTCSSPPSIDRIPLPPATSGYFAAAWFGVSGVDSPAAVRAITPALSALLGIPAGPDLVIANDSHLLAAPVRLHSNISHAIAVIAGTGATAVAFKEVNGNLEELGRIGGWGWILGDEGGGFHVGREAVRQILMAHDKASVEETSPAKSTLTAHVLERFGVTDVMELLAVVHTPEPPPTVSLDANAPPYLLIPREKRLSSLCPLVFSAAFEDADPLALNVLHTCAAILASYIAVLLGEGSDNAPRAVKAQESVISFGGSLAGIEAYRKMVLDDLARRGHVFRCVEFVDDAAAVGAVGLAAAHGKRENVDAM